MRYFPFPQAIWGLTLTLLVCLLTLTHTVHAQSEATSIHWFTDCREAQQQAIRTGKPIMMDLYADWCPQCKSLDAKTFPDLRVVGLAKKMVCLRLNAQEGDGALFASEYHIRGYPTILFLTSGGQVIHKFDAYRAPQDFAVEMAHALIKQAENPELARYQKTLATWHVLLVVVRDTNIMVPENGQPITYQDRLTDQEIDSAKQSFLAMPQLAARLTQNRVHVDAKSIVLSDSVKKVSYSGASTYFPSASDIYPLIEPYDASGDWDSIVVFWKGSKVMHTPGIGGMRTPKGSTYSVVMDAAPSEWKRGQSGEVFLNLWASGAAAFFRQLGFSARIPPKDACGGEAYGYKDTAYDGWCTYYLPLLNGLVPFGGKLRGFDEEMWASGAPRHRLNSTTEKSESVSKSLPQ